MPSPSPSLRSPASPVSPLLFRILSLSLPSLLLQLLLFLPSTLTLLSLPTAAVSAYGVSSLTSNVSCIMILYGALQSLDTLLPVRFTDDPKTMYKVSFGSAFPRILTAPPSFRLRNHDLLLVVVLLSAFTFIGRCARRAFS